LNKLTKPTSTVYNVKMTCKTLDSLQPRSLFLGKAYLFKLRLPCVEQKWTLLIPLQSLTKSAKHCLCRISRSSHDEFFSICL